MTQRPTLQIGGLAEQPLALDAESLAALPAADQVDDVGRAVPGKTGRGVRLAALLARVRPRAGAAWLNVASRDASFAVSVPLSELEGAIVAYARTDGSPLPDQKGGPFRLLVPGHADECVHVKALARMELAAARGRDTRPVDDAEHAALHQKKRT